MRTGGCRRAAARGAGDQRRRDQVLHRLAELHRAAGGELDTGPDRCLAALPQLPEHAGARLGMRLELAPSTTLRDAVNLFVVARGFGLGIAQEAALKLKETCGLHAEAFSSAEVKHGPMALVRAGFPVLMFTQRRRNPRRHRGAGGRVRIARRARAARGRRSRAAPLSLPGHRRASGHRAAARRSRVSTAMANELALARGLDPDRPPHLNKVTETV